MEMTPSMLFVRDFRAVTGGHIKFSHYLEHAALSGLVRPWLYLVEGGADPKGLFDVAGVRRLDRLGPADSYFVAGLDWRTLDRAGIDMSGKVVVNLIQGVRHGHADDPRYPYLSRPAFRICSSQGVADALVASGRVNGEMVVIPNGVDLVDAQTIVPAPKPGTLFIGGLKNPDFARALAERLHARLQIDLCCDLVPRGEFLARLGRSSLAVLLPYPAEGYFLPAVEAMALRVPTVTADCIGNRGFCVHEQSCLLADYTIDSMAAAVLRLADDPFLCERLRQGGQVMAAGQTLASERRQFQSHLARIFEARHASL